MQFDIFLRVYVILLKPQQVSMQEFQRRAGILVENLICLVLMSNSQNPSQDLYSRLWIFTCTTWKKVLKYKTNGRSH